MMKYGFGIPIGLILVSLIFFAAVRFMSSAIEIPIYLERVINIILFLLGTAGVMAILPGFIIGTVGLAGSKSKD